MSLLVVNLWCISYVVIMVQLTSGSSSLCDSRSFLRTCICGMIFLQTPVTSVIHHSFTLMAILVDYSFSFHPVSLTTFMNTGLQSSSFCHYSWETVVVLLVHPIDYKLEKENVSVLNHTQPDLISYCNTLNGS